MRLPSTTFLPNQATKPSQNKWTTAHANGFQCRTFTPRQNVHPNSKSAGMPVKAPSNRLMNSTHVCRGLNTA